MNLPDPTPTQADTMHPSPEQLRAFACGELNDDSSEEIEQHLSGCIDCCALLDTEAEDPLAMLFRAADGMEVSTEIAAPSSIATRQRLAPPGYEFLEQLGQGGMGVVWKARQIALNRLVALKRLRSAGAASAEALARFRREAEAVARLCHANIVQIHEIGEHDGEPYLTLEYVDGGSLAQKLAAGPLPPGQAAALVETLARAMHHAHEHGILHRDLKPGNVLLDDDGSPKISDFGLAKQLDEATAHTQTGAILGTPSYMAPEQASGGQTAIGPSADVYALGAILYETLTGRPPFRGPTVLDTLAQVREREPVPPRQLQPGVPRDLQTICLKCLHKEPQRRYGAALELAEDLRCFAAGEPIRARPVGRLERSLKWMRRKPYQAMLVLTLLLAPLAVLAGVLWHNRQLQEEIQRAEDARTRAETAEETQRDNYRKARHTIRRLLERLDQWKPANVPEVSEFTEGILQEGLAYVESVLNASTKPDPEVRADAAELLTGIGMLQVYYRQPDRACSSLRRAAELWEQLRQEQPDNFGYHRGRLTCYRGLAAVAGDDRQTRAYNEKAIALAEEWYRLNPDDIDRTTDLAQAHHLLAVFFSDRWPNYVGEDMPHYQRSIELMEPLIAKHPEQSGCKQLLADSLGNLGWHYFRTERPTQAEASFRRAEALLAALMRDDPQHLMYPLSRAAVAQKWGNVAVAAGRVEEGISLCERAVQWCETVLRKEPKMGYARMAALNSHGALAEAYASAKRFQAALPHWDRVIALATGLDQLNYRFHRAQVRIKAGDRTRAAADADALAAEPACTPDMHYDCACIYALSGYGDKAIALLSKLHGNGYFKDADHLKNLRTDTDLDSLRRRDDFPK